MNKVFLSKPPAAVESWNKKCSWVKYGGVDDYLKIAAMGMLTGADVPDKGHVTELFLGTGCKTVDVQAMYNAGWLKKLVARDGLQQLKNGCFNLCGSLLSVELPSSLASIEAWAFANDRSMQSLAVYDSLSQVLAYSFFNCSGILQVLIKSAGGDAAATKAALVAAGVPETAKWIIEEE